MLDEREQRVVNDIARCGWHLMGVLAGENEPPFTYSIGMMVTLNHPEIVSFGLDHKVTASIINGTGDEIRNGRSFREPGLYDGLIHGFACKIRPVSKSFHPRYLGFAMWHRRHIGQVNTLEAVELLWPDKAGLFPDEPDCHPGAVALQPLL
jgi:hypothetical protein